MLSLTARNALHNLKEALVIRTVEPFTGADLCKHRVEEHRDGGLSLTRYALLLRQPAIRDLLYEAVEYYSEALKAPRCLRTKEGGSIEELD